jgi:hypothetical protein
MATAPFRTFFDFYTVSVPKSETEYEHRAFQTREDAQAWLKSEEASSIFCRAAGKGCVYQQNFWGPRRAA